MKTLFNKKYETYNDEAHELSKKAHDFLRPLIEEYSKSGFPMCEIQDVIFNEVGWTCAEIKLRKAAMLRKKERENEKNNNNSRK